MRLPDFLIIGGMRCGTTSLHNLLRGQPGLCFPPKKEVHFFDRRNAQLGTSVERYAALFASCADVKLCGEATPDYLYTNDCDKLIYEVAPQIKLIIILRNPVDRTWSHYLFSVFKQVEKLGFREALTEEGTRLAIKSNHSDIFFSYLMRSRYMEHIRRFEVLFGRKQLKVLFLEELIHSTRSVLHDLLSFLGRQDSLILDEVPHMNRIVRSRSLIGRLLPALAATKAMPRSDRKYLQLYFAEHNAQLAHWLGRTLPWD